MVMAPGFPVNGAIGPRYVSVPVHDGRDDVPRRRRAVRIRSPSTLIRRGLQGSGTSHSTVTVVTDAKGVVSGDATALLVGRKPCR